MIHRLKGISLFVVLLFALIGGGLACGSSSTTNTNASNGSPQPTKTYQTVQTFTGNGAKKTETFTIGDEWKIQWSCKGNTDVGVDGLLYITVYKQGESLPIDTSASTTCKASDAPTIGETTEHKGGTVYLDINTGIDWTITIQELK